MNILSAYLETRARVDEMSADHLYMFTRSKTLSNCEVTNLLTYVSCPSVSGGIDTYSEHFLTGEVLWYYGTGGKLWRINDNKANEKWWPVGYQTFEQNGVTYAYSYEDGATTYATLCTNNDDLNIIYLISEELSGETKWQKIDPEPVITQYTPETTVNVEGISGSGKYLSSPFAPTGATPTILLSDFLRTNGYMYTHTEADMPIETKYNIPEYAMNDFLGYEEDATGGVGDRYPYRFLLSYNCQNETKMYIPVNRETFTGWQNLVAEGKLFQSGDNGLVGIGAGAVIDGHMTEVMATSGATSWTDLVCDITSLPYVDYIILYGRDGAQALREISVNKSYYGTEEEY